MAVTRREDAPDCLHCERPARRRGVCNTCYAAALKIVKAGDATWELLEEKGLTKRPPHTNPLRAKFTRLMAGTGAGAAGRRQAERKRARPSRSKGEKDAGTGKT